MDTKINRMRYFVSKILTKEAAPRILESGVGGVSHDGYEYSHHQQYQSIS